MAVAGLGIGYERPLWRPADGVMGGGIRWLEMVRWFVVKV